MIGKRFVLACLLFLGVVLSAETVSAAFDFDYGGAFRLRQEYWEKLVDLETTGKPDRDFFRLRSTLWGKAAYGEDLGLYLRLTNEAKYYLGTYKPLETPDRTSDSTRFDVDELIVDNLHFDYKNAFGLPVDLRIGRQDFFGAYGEGFLIVDGTPGDGSRTAYFNAAKAVWRIAEGHSVDLVYLSDPKADTYLPSLYPARSDSIPTYVGNKRLLNASDEQGVILYGKSRINSYLAVEPYYIYKEEDPVGTNARLRLNTFGGRAVVTAGAWKVRAEFAHQFGEYANGRDRKANGGYLFAGRKHETVLFKPEWDVGYVYLSGDDPTTRDHEGWDPLFSRAPAWNEVYVYPLANETANDSGPIPAYWTNLHIYMAGVKLSFTDATNLAVTYQYLRSDQATSGLNPAMFSNGSKERGQVATLVLNHNFTKRLSGLLQAEYFIPGNFYTDKAENAALLRWQLNYRF
ncbi:MAG: alginate export family protein [Deltaproteobacteria bacterium]|nr:alginate export family protein [Deltaproteobacteria bacterium]